MNIMRHTNEKLENVYNSQKVALHRFADCLNDTREFIGNK